MCGFLGQFNTANLNESIFRQLLLLSAHRGPDQTGFWEAERIQLGFNRLAILDLSKTGNQPMVSPHGKYVVVFNGEIYNHFTLRKKLPPYNFCGHSDTETLTYAFDVWGIRKTIEALEGMFALAIYSISDERLTLVRDFAGIKPLFYGDEKGQIVFASQYDQVKRHPLFQHKGINPEILKLYLQQHFVPAPFGLHFGIRQVHPGEMITFSKTGEVKKECYWNFPDTLPSDLITDAKEAQRVFALSFEESVRNQLVADVPLGAFLSGGVDSPLVCAYAKKHKQGIEVFSIGSDSKLHDESERASQFAKTLQLNQFLWKLDAKEMRSNWDEAISALHEPLADFSILPTYLVSKLARKHVTVALSGDGGDELFFGYERFWSIGKNLPFHHLPGFLRKSIYGFDKLATNNKRVNSVLTVKRQGAAHEGLHNRFSQEWINKIAPDLQMTSLPEEWQVYNYPNTKNERQLMAQMRKAEFYGMMQKTLRKVDLASMQNSLEVRVPFLHKNLIEVAMQIDPLLSYGPNCKKQVLKLNLLNICPNIPDDNVKRGFTIPLGNWIREGLYDQFESALNELAAKDNIFGEKAMKQLLLSHNEGRDLKWPLFTLYALNQI